MFAFKQTSDHQKSPEKSVSAGYLPDHGAEIENSEGIEHMLCQENSDHRATGFQQTRSSICIIG
jgi:hypothetical protein